MPKLWVWVFEDHQGMYWDNSSCLSPGLQSLSLLDKAVDMVLLHKT